MGVASVKLLEILDNAIKGKMGNQGGNAVAVSGPVNKTTSNEDAVSINNTNEAIRLRDIKEKEPEPDASQIDNLKPRYDYLKSIADASDKQLTSLQTGEYARIKEAHNRWKKLPGLTWSPEIPINGGKRKTLKRGGKKSRRKAKRSQRRRSGRRGKRTSRR